MIRFFAMLLLVSAIVPPQESEAEARARKRAEEVLATELRAMQESLADLVRRELIAKPPPPPIPAATVDKALALVTEETLRKHAFAIAADDMEGRNSGYAGNVKAADYLIENLKKFGVAPAGDADAAGGRGYRQAFKVFDRPTANVVGLIEGTDPDLKKEIIVLGAHFDHIGTSDQGHPGRLGGAEGDDTTYNGADDNGSGTTTLLGVARAMGEGGLRARRSVLIIFFSGEEGGLLGSVAYVKKPISPLRQHVCMMNFDMVGRPGEKPLGVEGVGSAEGGILRRVIQAAADKVGLKVELTDGKKPSMGDSDNSTFRERGIPWVFFHSGLHADWHKVTDHPEKLNYKAMVKVAHTAVHAVLELGNAEDSPTFRKIGVEVPPAPRRTRTLGVTPTSDFTPDDVAPYKLAAEEWVVKIESIREGSVASKAGVKVGDFILSIGGTKIGRRAPLDDLKLAVAKVVAFRDVEVVVGRGGERVKLKAVWEED